MSTNKERVTISPELRQRLIAARDNGSTAAAKILEALRKPRVEIMRSNLADNFYSKRFVSNHNEYKSLVIKIGMCRKDFSNENNPDHGIPDAEERPSNQIWRTPSQFALEFKGISFSDDELTYFDSVIKETSKVTIRISNRFKDFVDAYTGANYSIFGDNEAPLHSSCMRYDNTAEIAADFYKNFAGCRIMIATNKQNEIVGRAIIWDGIDVVGATGGTSLMTLGSNMSFMDRKYYSFSFIRTLMLNYAREHGIDFYKTYDDINHQLHITPFKDIMGFNNNSGHPHFRADDAKVVYLRKNVPHVKWHKKGAPYVDTLSYVCFDNESSRLYLCNNEEGVTNNEYKLATCRSTNGYALSGYYICPKCGAIHSSCPEEDYHIALCSTCRADLFKDTPFGYAYSGKLIKHKGLLIPSEVAKSPFCDMAINVGRLLER